MEVSIPLLDIFLIAGRLGGMIFTAPIFGSRNYPIPMKIGLIFFTTMIVYPFVNTTLTYDVSTFWGFAILMVNELMIGLFIGLLISVYFHSYLFSIIPSFVWIIISICIFKINALQSKTRKKPIAFCYKAPCLHITSELVEDLLVTISILFFRVTAFLRLSATLHFLE